ncbi:hypothetical protein BGI40_09780 [Snodgrassella communis]|uniref:Uncharacterized protein n=1 Tax=Snodgrassella communis TaxID=2946699 RepID=A0A836MS14_9NEIS|nr:hypothetical protein [Snodgrassella communis]KDN15375.1 hypothetical protein SALWKB29_0479 [Snodgrassella communis]PIT09392.1 hypothetical protein BGI29_06400 [Snodgrassella communis]PIT26448.1 hypothetical protein BGI38_07825 [Snodgrassella communis]PIT28636.1 hypothetical protein BGI39_05540 [Snodgrassella communis]PIT31226.1 hypothetical protein BGI40_09780 [Snodgrassella communis]
MLWLFIAIITLTFVLPLLSVWIVVKVTALAKAHPKPAKYTLITMFIILMVVVGLKIRDIYYEKSPYYFWNELIRKNPKPFNVSQKEFEAKNRAGYCWRDRKYYSKEELWYKAMKSLTGRMIYENKFYWDNKIVNDNGEFLPTEDECVRQKGCRVFKIPMNPDKEKFLKDNIENENDFWKGIDVLIKHNEAQSFIFASDQNYINDDFKLKNYILIHKLDDPAYLSVYDSNNCCTIFNKSEWSLIRKNYILKYTGIDTVVFRQESKIPIDININSWGVGNFYLSVTYSKSISVPEFVAKDKSETFKDSRRVYLLNNCGDVLYRPNYWWRR